jgi:prolyl-tRNA editing enzyme YbaK/EbsC (Cys-tRNA(Pro) deacylase)
MPTTPVTRALDALALPYRLHLHAGPVRSLEQAARERGLAPGQVVRSLVFRLEDGSFVMVLVAGPARVSWAKLRRYLQVSRLTTATPDEVLQVTGYPPGAVSPFGLPQPLRLLADRSLLDSDLLSLGAGVPNAGVILAGQDLLRTLSPEIDDFTG